MSSDIDNTYVIDTISLECSVLLIAVGRIYSNAIIEVGSVSRDREGEGENVRRSSINYLPVQSLSVTSYYLRHLQMFVDRIFTYVPLLAIVVCIHVDNIESDT